MENKLEGLSNKERIFQYIIFHILFFLIILIDFEFINRVFIQKIIPYTIIFDMSMLVFITLFSLGASIRIHYDLYCLWRDRKNE